MIDQGLTAIGRVKELSLITAPIYLLNVPLVYLALKSVSLLGRSILYP